MGPSKGLNFPMTIFEDQVKHSGWTEEVGGARS